MHRRSLLRSMVALALVGAFAWSPACARRRAPRPPPAPVLSVVEARVDVVLGRRLVIPVTVQGGLSPRRPVPVRLDDGRTLEARLAWLSVGPEPEAEPNSWVDPAGRWASVWADADRRPEGAGGWLLIVDLPLDSVGQGLYLGTTRVPLNWLPDPALLTDPASGRELPWPRPIADLGESPHLLRLAQPERTSPVRRWRYRLLTRGLQPRPAPALTGGEPAPAETDEFADPVIEAVARQVESRWQVALAWLWIADADLAERVRQRLAGAVRYGERVVAPAWTIDQPALDALLLDLLDPRLRAHERRERALAWLSSLPTAVAWVIDDAGLRDAGRVTGVGQVGVANLSDRAALAWVGVGMSAELTSIPAGAAGELPVLMPRSDDGGDPGAKGPLRVVAHVGPWSGPCAVALRPIEAAPPGLRLGPLLADWTMRTWMGGVAPPEPSADWAGLGLLQKSGDGSWTLFLEFRGPARTEPEGARVWLGPRERPVAVFRVSSTGLATEEVGRGSTEGVQVSREPDRWTVRLTIPAGTIEPDGIVRIGLERTDGRGVRSAWPRPMLPWQVEPGRVAVDLSAWVGLPAVGGTR
ncbi:MAG: hypothetical protein JNM80_12605 [Phycisphaerae bacterium]|nr:hypothetical protein [Phycisphaerae bacterium]